MKHILAPFGALVAVVALVGASPSVPTAPARVAPQFTFSCNPTAYMHGTETTVTAGKEWRTPAFRANAVISYYPVLGFCGLDNAFLPANFATVVRHWSEQTERITVSKGQVPGCAEPVGHPLYRKGETTFDCTVRTWYADITFYRSIPWNNHPRVALWFEAWGFNVLRDWQADAHLTLIQVH